MDIKANLLRASTWTRGFFMLVYAIIFSIVKFVIGAVVIFQFGSMLLTGQVNERLLTFAQSLSVYTYQIICFLTYVQEEKPFPLSPWPKATPLSNLKE